MKTPDEIMLKNGLRVEWLKKYEPDTYDNIRKSMDDFADQYAEWKLKKFSERQTTTEVSDNHESKALNIADVVGSNSENDNIFDKIIGYNSDDLDEIHL